MGKLLVLMFLFTICSNLLLSWPEFPRTVFAHGSNEQSIESCHVQTFSRLPTTTTTGKSKTGTAVHSRLENLQPPPLLPLSSSSSSSSSRLQHVNGNVEAETGAGAGTSRQSQMSRRANNKKLREEEGHPTGSLLGVVTPDGGSSSPSSSTREDDNAKDDKHQEEGDEIIVCEIRVLKSDLNIVNLTSSLVRNSPRSNSQSQSRPEEGIIKLKLICNDLLFFQSFLESGQLAPFINLEELFIDKCKLSNFSLHSLTKGLPRLRHLTITTGNSEWPARTLEILPEPSSSSSAASEETSISSLRHLDLGFNNIWALAHFCFENLLTLNLTHNILSNINDLGLSSSSFRRQNPIPASSSSSLPSSETNRNFPILLGSKQQQQKEQNEENFETENSCGYSNLKSLDLSFNSLRTLGHGKLTSLTKLQILQLNNNLLMELEPAAFEGLVALRQLNLSSNRLTFSLPHNLFQSMRHLRELDLRNNSLAQLSSPGDRPIFRHLEHLQILDVSLNRLAGGWISLGVFKGLYRLIVLNLNNNQLTHLSKTTFQDLYSLQILDLSYNLIGVVEDGTFEFAKNLHSLKLTGNRLTIVNANTFNGLVVLHKLILDYNQISTVHEVAFKNCSSLQDLGLGGNRLTQVPPALRGLASLRTLDIGENLIEKISSNETFQGLSQLYGLRIVGNLLTEIPKGFCANVPKLRALNLGQNKINQISLPAFVSCPDLRVLRIDSNQLATLTPALAQELPSLLWLNASGNFIQRLDYSSLPQRLEWLDVSFNFLESLWLGSYSHHRHGQEDPFSSSSSAGGQQQQQQQQQNNRRGGGGRLRVLDASHNNLTQLDQHSIPPTLELLKLSHNKISKINPDTFTTTVKLRRVELNENLLTNIQLQALRLRLALKSPSSHQTPAASVEFFLSGNPFICNCDMEWLTRSSYPVLVVDMEAIVCQLPFSRANNPSFRSLADMKSQDFLCPYESHCFALCECCDFSACDCAMNCPDNCTCYHDDTWSANVIDCASSNHSVIPLGLPMDSTEVYLDGNTIRELKSHTFIGRKNMRVLYLNASRIEKIANKSFNGLQSLQILHLQQNRLDLLHGYEFDHLFRLKELYLNDNLIRVISNNTFLPLKSLEVLHLQGNLLVTFSMWQLNLNRNLMSIGMSRNSWNCECEFLQQLYKWSVENSRKIVDLTEIRCRSGGSASGGGSGGQQGPLIQEYNVTCGGDGGNNWSLLHRSGSGGLSFDLYSGYLFGVILGSSFLLLLLICSFITLWTRCGLGERVQLWIFHHFHVRVTRPGFCCGCFNCDSDDKKMMMMGSEKDHHQFERDAYFIYSVEDEEFVTKRIVDELEDDRGYRLFLHYRDVVPMMRRGGGLEGMSDTNHLKSTMRGAIQGARTLVMVVSQNFLRVEWASDEFRAAFHHAVSSSTSASKGGGGGGGRDNDKSSLTTTIHKSPILKSAIVILKDDETPIVKIDSDSFLNGITTTARNGKKKGGFKCWTANPKRTIRWSDEGNWTKFTFLLPDPMALSMMTMTMDKVKGIHLHQQQAAAAKYGSPNSTLLYKSNFHSNLLLDTANDPPLQPTVTVAAQQQQMTNGRKTLVALTSPLKQQQQQQHQMSLYARRQQQQQQQYGNFSNYSHYHSQDSGRMWPFVGHGMMTVKSDNSDYATCQPPPQPPPHFQEILRNSNFNLGGHYSSSSNSTESTAVEYDVDSKSVGGSSADNNNEHQNQQQQQQQNVVQNCASSDCSSNNSNRKLLKFIVPPPQSNSGQVHHSNSSDEHVYLSLDPPSPSPVDTTVTSSSTMSMYRPPSTPKSQSRRHHQQHQQQQHQHPHDVSSSLSSSLSRRPQPSSFNSPNFYATHASRSSNPGSINNSSFSQQQQGIITNNGVNNSSSSFQPRKSSPPALHYGQPPAQQQKQQARIPKMQTYLV